jgi:fructoselysine-6-P-deglycase FrlB-like protein
MNILREMREIPRALGLMWEESRVEYDALVRQAGWVEGPVFLTGKGSSYLAGLTGAYAFESLFGSPAVVRPPATFSAYTGSVTAPRSLFIAISGSGECGETVKAARVAKNRGAFVCALTGNRDSALGKLANGVANLPACDPTLDGPRTAFLQHAALILLAIVASRARKRLTPQIESLEKEIQTLPREVDWVLTQMAGAAETLAREITALPRLLVTGGGFYHPVAIQAAAYLRRTGTLEATGLDLARIEEAPPDAFKRGAGILILAGSGCRLKSEAHQAAREARQNGGMQIFALTDNNDRQLSDRATLALLLPALSEPAGALLRMVLLNMVIHYAARNFSLLKNSQPPLPTARRSPPGA